MRRAVRMLLERGGIGVYTVASARARALFGRGLEELEPRELIELLDMLGFRIPPIVSFLSGYCCPDTGRRDGDPSETAIRRKRRGTRLARSRGRTVIARRGQGRGRLPGPAARLPVLVL